MADRDARERGRRTPRARGLAGAAVPPLRRVPAEDRADELPLIAWGEAQGARLARRRRAWRVTALAGLGAGALALTLAFPPAPRLVWNASPSVPVGLYRVWPAARVATGDMVVVRLPDAARALAARRRYLPASVPAVKRIAATAGARVCARGAAIFIDGVRVATRLAVDRRGRPLPWWRGCRRLAPNEIFLLVKGSPRSFDGRYFGPSRRRDVIGRACLLFSPAGASPRRD